MPELFSFRLPLPERFLRSSELVAALAWRDIAGRYRGSLAGLFWSFLNPLFSLAMYTFVFGVVFQARWGMQAESTFDFALILFAGLLLHSLLADCIGAAPFLVVGNPSYVKQVVFPLEVLAVVALLSSLFHAAISLFLLLLVWFLSHRDLHLASLAIPLLLLPLCLISLGCAWILSALAVYFRDIGQIVNFVLKALLFFSPIFYPATSVPAPFRFLLSVNPLTYAIEHVRAVLISGELPEAISYFAYLSLAIGFACLGYAVFQKLRAGFADVI